MRTTFLATAAAVAAAALFVLPALADNTCTPEQNKVLYELQERCGEDAGRFLEYMAAHHSDGYDADDDFEAHYSRRFNKCFARLDDFQGHGPDDRIYHELWSVNEHKLIGDYTNNPETCWIVNPDTDKQDDCVSQDPLRNWDTITKPYMEDGEVK